MLALSFALLALVPIRAFRELAFTMSVGLLIDAFVVRTLLVPALMALVGPRAGWPGTRLAGRDVPVAPAAPAVPVAPVAPLPSPVPGPAPATGGHPPPALLRAIAWLAVIGGVLRRLKRR